MTLTADQITVDGDTRRSVEVRPYGRGRAIYLGGQFVSDHYTQDSLAAAHANILKAEGWR